MRTPLRVALVAAAALATLLPASAAFAANTATISVSHTPMVLAGSSSTTIHISIPQSTDPIAAINIYVPTGYGANLSQPAGTTIGNVDATAFSHDTGLTVPLSGSVVTDSPSKYTSASTQCTGNPAPAAVWVLNLSVAGQAIQLPLYVLQTSGAEQSLGAYKLSICLPPPDVPQGTPGRSALGAQVLDARFTVNSIFTTPPAGGQIRWESLFTPYNPGKGTVNPLGTFEARAFVPLPIVLGLHAKLNKKTHAAVLSGSLSLGGVPAAGATIRVFHGAKGSQVAQFTTTTVSSRGTWKLTTRVKKPTYFQVKSQATETAVATGCQNPLPATVAPAGCVSATLSPWSATSVLLRVKP